MTDCTCPVAGYCERHRIDKSEHWHHLCQTKPKYRAAWDEGRGPNQPRHPLSPERLAARERVRIQFARQDRLLSWLYFLRHDSDRGAGDVADRLMRQSRKHPDAHEPLDRLLRQCSCSRTDAVARLNEQYPYSSRPADSQLYSANQAEHG